jgi:hypothetical protein
MELSTRWFTLLSIACCAVGLASEEQPRRKLSEVKTRKYGVGQVWSFKGRPGEESATLTIVRVESGKGLPVIVHVSLDDVRIANPHAPGGFTRIVEHAAFTEDAISRSVTKLVRQVKELPPYEEGYERWCDYFDQGKVGINTITVAEMLAGMERNFAKEHPLVKE